MTPEDASPVGRDGALEPAAALAGQVAHDLGNVLTVVLGNGEMLAEALAGTPELAELAARILRAAERGTALLDRLDLFAREIPVPAVPTDIAGLLAGHAERLAPALPRGVTLDLAIAPEAGQVAVDADSLLQALDELVDNALAALGDRGRIWIAATGPDGQGRIRITVADDGPGMTRALRRLAAKPVFASGVAGHRTGLGLALVARLVAAGGGRLFIGGRPGGGTAATIELQTVANGT